MSQWNGTHWRGLVDGTECPICQAGWPQGIVAELEAAYLTSGADAPMRGYCALVLKRHAVELHELDAEEAAAFMRDIQRTGRAVQELTGAVKLNYEIHGNTIPHLHLHLFPRYPGDPFEGGPIDPRSSHAPPYAPGEFEEFVQALQSRLSPA
jgi:diadenosine tetraphosphate (Ap4A) HIT family hydrolase